MLIAPLLGLETDRLHLRGWRAGDATQLSETIEANLDHLRPWLPWADDEPLSRAARFEWIARCEVAFQLGTDLYLGVWQRETGTLVGGAGLHPIEPGGPLELGYWITRGSLRKGFAREVAMALTRYAFAIEGIEHLSIRVWPDNVPSARVAESLGYAGPAPCHTAEDDRCGAGQRVHVYRMDAAGCARATWLTEPVTMLDTQGERHSL